MAPAPTFRVIRSGAIDPALSMVLDEALLGSAADTERPPTLHLYRRDRPTVSVGYSVEAATEVDLEACRARGVAVHRRTSGGGAIYTDPGTLLLGFSARDTYGAVPDSHRALCGPMVTALQRLGATAEFAPANDVLVRGRKIAGCAQARRNGALLHQASLLVSVDRAAMTAVLRPAAAKLARHGVGDPGGRVASLAEIVGRDVAPAEVMDGLEVAFTAFLGARPQPGGLTAGEEADVERLFRDRAADDRWAPGRQRD